MSAPRQVAFEIWKDGLTGGIQLSIGSPSGSGYRIAGPKFSGNSILLKQHVLDARDAAEIRAALNRAFPTSG